MGTYCGTDCGVLQEKRRAWGRCDRETGLNFLRDFYYRDTPVSIKKSFSEPGKMTLLVSSMGEEFPVEIFLPIKSVHPPVFLVHGMGITGKFKKRFLHIFAFLLRNGFPLVFYPLPYHLERKPEAGPGRILNDTDYFEFFAKSYNELIRIRKYVAGMFNRDEAYLLGYSAGSFISLIAHCLEEKFTRTVLFAAGGGIEKITWNGTMRFVLRKNCSRKVCKNMHKTYNVFLKKGLLEEIAAMPRKCFFYDPLTFAGYLNREETFLISGVFDPVIIPGSFLALKKSLKGVKTLLLPAGHLSVFFFKPFFAGKILQFFSQPSPD